MVQYRRNAVLPVIVALSALVSLSAKAAESPADNKITFWVKEALREDPRVISSDVEVKTDKGIVTLTGVVKALAEKKYADLESKKIKNVRGVINKIIVLPGLRTDTDITQDILRRFLNNAELRPSGIWVKVVDGEVNLSGRVNSWSEREEAELLATEVRGVKSVVNQVQVRYKKERPDDDIRKDVIAAIGRDVYLSCLPISVSVEDGIVSLKGSVGGAYQKDRATDDSLFVENVKSVKNDLEVQYWENQDIRKMPPAPSDGQIEKAVREELIQDYRFANPFELSIEVMDGDVTLRGPVYSYYQKMLAGEDTWDVVGVGRVANLLTVKADRREDPGIQNDIQFEMDVDPVLNGQDIHIRVKQGIVTLTGGVNTFYEKAHAADVASKVLGVRDVINAIDVDRASRYTDNALRDRIKRRLASNAITGSVSDRIKVEVSNGKAILTGSVFTPTEYRESARLALLTEGIRGLDNRLAMAGQKSP